MGGEPVPSTARDPGLFHARTQSARAPTNGVMVCQVSFELNTSWLQDRTVAQRWGIEWQCMFKPRHAGRGFHKRFDLK